MEIVIKRGNGCLASVLLILLFPSWRRKMKQDGFAHQQTKQNTMAYLKRLNKNCPFYRKRKAGYIIFFTNITNWKAERQPQLQWKIGGSSLPTRSFLPRGLWMLTPETCNHCHPLPVNVLCHLNECHTRLPSTAQFSVRITLGRQGCT